MTCSSSTLKVLEVPVFAATTQAVCVEFFEFPKPVSDGVSVIKVLGQYFLFSVLMKIRPRALFSVIFEQIVIPPYNSTVFFW